jgi:hypothetical protein
MWQFADRVARAVSDVTLGTAIVVVHVALARRQSTEGKLGLPASTIDGRRIWRTQISP